MWVVLFAVLALLKLQYVWYDIRDPWTATTTESKDIRQQLPILQKIFFTSVEKFARFWNGYEIHNTDQLHHLQGGRLLVGYHSRPTLDLLYFFCTLKPKILVSYLIFKIPFLNKMLGSLGIISSKSNDKGNAETFLENLTTGGKPLVLLPGGAFECLKRFDQRYQVLWKDEPGFARIMCKSRKEITEAGGVYVIPFYTTHCEEIYWQTEWSYNTTHWVIDKLYSSFKDGNILIMPIMLTSMMWSLGFLILPMRLKLDTYLGDPLTMMEDESSEAFAARVKKSLEKLIIDSNTIALSKPKFVRSAGIPDAIYTASIGTLTFLQNLCFVVLLTVFFWISVPSLLLFTLWRMLGRYGGSNEYLKGKQKRK